MAWFDEIRNRLSSLRHRDQYEDAATHVRVLELYNPEMLRMLYRERAERLGDEEDLELFDQAGEEEIDDWTVKLEGIDTAMLGQAVAHAAGRHIDQDGYAALVRGAAEGLSLMIQTEGIEEVFTGLSEDRKVGQLQTTLDDIIDDMALGQVGDIIFTPDEQTIISTHVDGTILLWPTLEQLVELGCSQVRRNLTHSEWDYYIGNKHIYQNTCENLPTGTELAHEHDDE